MHSWELAYAELVHVLGDAARVGPHPSILNGTKTRPTYKLLEWIWQMPPLSISF
jgi:hypothetical protein